MEHLESLIAQIAEELLRLDCLHYDDPDHGPCLDLVTLWDGRHQAWQLRPGGEPRDEAARDEYDYLQTHGYDAYWAWVAERDPHAGAPWAFFLDFVPTITDRLTFRRDQAEAVLACVRTLPDGCGVHRVWAALNLLRA